MLMVCPNCQSSDIVSVQDQFFCVSCGQLVPPQAAKPVAEVAPKKKGPGRPRAAALDTPVAPVESEVTPVPVSAPSITPAAAASQAKGRTMDALAPRQTDGVTAKAPAKASAKTVAPSPLLAALAALELPWIAAAWPGLLAFGVAALVLWQGYSVAGCGTSLVVWQNHWQLLALAFGLAWLGWLWLRGVVAAVVFHRAGVHDQRLEDSGSASRAVISRFGRIVLLELPYVAVQLVLITLLVALALYGVGSTNFPVTWQAGGVFALSLGILYLMGAEWVMRDLTLAAMMVSGLSLRQSRRLAWRLWCRHMELLGARLCGRLADLVIGAGVIALIWELEFDQPSLAAGLSVVAIVAAFSLMTVSGAGGTEAIYRQLVGTQDGATTLLAGRRAVIVRPRRVAAVILLVCLPAMAGAAALALR